MGAGELEDALQTFSALIKSHPEFTEAWNKRATVYFLLGRHHLNPNPSPNPNPNPKPNPNPNPSPTPNPSQATLVVHARHDGTMWDEQGRTLVLYNSSRPPMVSALVP